MPSVAEDMNNDTQKYLSSELQPPNPDNTEFPVNTISPHIINDTRWLQNICFAQVEALLILQSFIAISCDP